MRLSIPAFAIVLSAAVSTGCGDSSFGGGSSKKAGSSQNAGHTSDDSKSLDGSKDGGNDEIKLPKDPTKEQEAIGKCLAAWGSGNPFANAAFTDYRKISASVNVLGSGGYAIEDTEITEGPKLILVKASVSVLGETNYLLLNPNGWYCFMVDVNVLSKTTVDLQCKAKLADSRVAVNVLSKPASTAAVGVNALSSVKVNRIKNEAKDSCL
jgi:hypothetical protein